MKLHKMGPQFRIDSRFQRANNSTMHTSPAKHGAACKGVRFWIARFPEKPRVPDTKALLTRCNPPQSFQILLNLGPHSWKIF